MWYSVQALQDTTLLDISQRRRAASRDAQSCGMGDRQTPGWDAAPDLPLGVLYFPLCWKSPEPPGPSLSLTLKHRQAPVQQTLLKLQPRHSSPPRGQGQAQGIFPSPGEWRHLLMSAVTSQLQEQNTQGSQAGEQSSQLAVKAGVQG
jgi:hypothetical protein